MSSHTPGPWRYEPGGGHAYNRIVGSESVQVGGWPERINGISNASYSDRVCENLGDINLPGPAANAKLIIAAPKLLEAARNAEAVLARGKWLDTSPDPEAVALRELRAAIAEATA